MERYVCGFAFELDTYSPTNNLLWVYLIRKNQPAWQKGFYNGIGGKIQIRPDETPEEAMIREFREEAGCEVTAWLKFCVITNEEAGTRVHFFATMAHLRGRIQSPTDEEVALINPSEIYNGTVPVISNLKWLIPLAMDGANVDVIYIEESKRKE